MHTLFGGASAEQIFRDIKTSVVKLHGLMFQYLDSLVLIKFKPGGEIDIENLNWKAIHVAINERFEFHFKNPFIVYI